MDFFKMFAQLARAKPWNATHSRSVENAPFGDYLSRSKNVYICFYSTGLEDCYYSCYLQNCRDCVDSTALYNSELCYECVDCSELYNCRYLQDSHNCVNCSYGYDLINCKNCFASFGLRNQEFCIFNKKYPTEYEYLKKLESISKTFPARILEIMAPEIDKHPRIYARLLKGGEKCIGDYIYFGKNCYQCFNVREAVNCSYFYDEAYSGTPTIDSVDQNFCGGMELCYDCSNSSFCHNCNFLENCSFMSDSEYSVNCSNSRNLFGCAYLQNKEYHILNRPFSRDEYLVTVRQIKDELGKLKEYGKPISKILIEQI